MSNNLKPQRIEQLLAEADELIRQIHSDTAKDMEEAHRLEFEQHAKNLNKIKSEVHGKVEDKDSSGLSDSAEGMHEAIQDIVKAMTDLKNKLF